MAADPSPEPRAAALDGRGHFSPQPSWPGPAPSAALDPRKAITQYGHDVWQVGESPGRNFEEMDPIRKILDHERFRVDPRRTPPRRWPDQVA